VTGATGVNADGEVAALSASRAPFLIGVRHHSPALAVAVPRLLDGFGPDMLAVELPAQARAWVDWLAHPETVAPVALAFSRGEGMSFYPFADFSPELAALRWARGAGVEVACEKDYIRHVKPNGYRSLHLVLLVDGRTYIEVQIRTISQDTWAALEHQMKYKHEIAGDASLIIAELKRCADELASTDISMQTIRDMIRGTIPRDVVAVREDGQ